MRTKTMLCVLGLLVAWGACAQAEAVEVENGLIVCVGAEALESVSDRWNRPGSVIQCLETSDAKVADLRKRIQAAGCYGKVSVVSFDGRRLPYVGNLANLVIVGSDSQVSESELQRVAAPYGTVIAAGKKTIKPYPEAMDEWPQHYHGPDNNAVSQDTLVGPPRRVQWISDPRWSRSHLGLPSVTSVVSAHGRVFSIEDLVSAEYPALPGKFALVARDAFNGIELWRHPFKEWEPVTRHIKSTPIQLQRRLVALESKFFPLVICTPGFDTPITVFDGMTGKTLLTYEGTENTQEFVFDNDVLYVVAGDPMNSHGDVKEYQGFNETAFPLALYGRETLRKPDPKCSIAAFDTNSNKPLWEVPSAKTSGYQAGTLAVRGERVVFCTMDEIVCLDRRSGDELWRAPNEVVMVSPKRVNGPEAMTGIAPALVLTDDAVYIADVITLKAYSIKDGKHMWSGKAYPNHFKPSDLFVAQGTIWSGTLEGYDPLTGDVRKTLTQQMTGPMVHDRCYRNRITENYYIDTKTGGSDFLDLASDTEFPNPWVRGTCGIGATPCNGLLYAPPAACSCSNWVMINSFNALAPEPGLKSSDQSIDVKAEAILEKGPAYGKVTAPKSAAKGWNTYRGDGGRSGVTKATAPATFKRQWTVKVSTRASAPTIAGGKLFVADIDAHAVRAFDADSGEALWSYTTGARIDSPPTIHNGLALFGSRDGWVYCLRASDGVLVWRFRGLPDDRWVCVYGQVESAWPVFGSVLVKDDVAYFAAGRNSFLDGGIWLFGLDPQSGRVLHERHMYGPFGDDGFPIIANDISGGFGLHGFKNDVLMADGESLFIRQQGFKTDLTPIDPKTITKPHLIASAGFLEPVPHHRTWMTIDTTIRYDTTMMKAGGPNGDILVKDGDRFYEMRGYPPGRTTNFNPRSNGYTLYAGVLSKTPVTPPARAPKAKAGAKNRTARPAKPVTERWSNGIPLTGKAMALADESLFVAGTPVVFPEGDLHKAYEGRMGGVIWAASTTTGEKIAETKLAAAPAWDAMAVADGRLYISLEDGSVVCLGSK